MVLTSVYLLIVGVEVSVLLGHIKYDKHTHTHTHTHSVRNLWASNQSVAETSLPDKYNIPNTHTYLHQKGFEPAFPASFRPQTDVLYRVATGTGSCGLINKFNKLIGKSVD